MIIAAFCILINWVKLARWHPNLKCLRSSWISLNIYSCPHTINWHSAWVEYVLSTKYLFFVCLRVVVDTCPTLFFADTFIQTIRICTIQILTEGQYYYEEAAQAYTDSNYRNGWGIIISIQELAFWPLMRILTACTGTTTIHLHFVGFFLILIFKQAPSSSI